MSPKCSGPIRRFAADQRGSVAIVFSFVSVVLVTAAGMSIDVARLYSAQARLTMALDAAVLSTARNITLGTIEIGDAERVVTDFVIANIDQSDFYGSAVRVDEVRVDTAEKTLAVDASLDLPMTLTKIVGVDSRRVATASSARYSNMRIEVAMALDITGSMNNAIPGTSTKRIDALKDAAKLGIDAMLKANAASPRVRIGLVPYARSVDATPVIDLIETDAPTDGCVIERTGSEAHTDHFATFAHPVGAVADADRCPRSPILPMTASKAVLDTHIDDLRTHGWTAGHVAIAWTQYMLSSKWNDAWPDGSDAAPDTDAGARKVAIIMTDGQFNTFDSSGHDPDSDEAKTLSRSAALSICSQMKSRNIAVYTIAFSAGADAIDLMRDCATPDNAQVTGSCTAPGSAVRRFFFSANNQVELESAFKAIADDITCLRLTG